MQMLTIRLHEVTEIHQANFAHDSEADRLYYVLAGKFAPADYIPHGDDDFGNYTDRTDELCKG